MKVGMVHSASKSGNSWSETIDLGRVLLLIHSAKKFDTKFKMAVIVLCTGAQSSIISLLSHLLTIYLVILYSIFLESYCESLKTFLSLPHFISTILVHNTIFHITYNHWFIKVYAICNSCTHCGQNSEICLKIANKESSRVAQVGPL